MAFDPTRISTPSLGSGSTDIDDSYDTIGQYIRNSQEQGLMEYKESELQQVLQGLESTREERTIQKTKDAEQALSAKTRILQLAKEQDEANTQFLKNIFIFLFILSLSIFPIILRMGGRISSQMNIYIIITIVIIAVIVILVRNYRMKPKVYKLEEENDVDGLGEIQSFLRQQAEELEQNIASDIYQNCDCSSSSDTPPESPDGDSPPEETTDVGQRGTLIPSVQFTYPDGYTEQIAPELSGADFRASGSNEIPFVTSHDRKTPETLFDFARYLQTVHNIPRTETNNNASQEELRRLANLCTQAPNPNSTSNDVSDLSIPDFVTLALEYVYRGKKEVTPTMIADWSNQMHSSSSTPSELIKAIFESNDFRQTFGSVRSWLTYARSHPTVLSLDKYQLRTLL